MIGSTAESTACRPIMSSRALRAISVPPDIAMYGTTTFDRGKVRSAVAKRTQEITQPPDV